MGVGVRSGERVSTGKLDEFLSDRESGSNLKNEGDRLTVERYVVHTNLCLGLVWSYVSVDDGEGCIRREEFFFSLGVSSSDGKGIPKTGNRHRSADI